MENNRSRTTSIPFPSKGENSRDPVFEMDPMYALSMVNVFPVGSYGQVRNGYSVDSTTYGSGSIQFLYELALKNGTRQLVIAGGGGVYKKGTGTALGSGFTSNWWEAATYLNTMIMCNGVDQPQQYDGTTLSAANYTGIADDAKLIDVCVYKERLYFIDKDNQSVWYGATGTITGALTEFPLGDFFSKGGYCQAISSWTTNTGSGLQDLLVIISSEGEVLCYSGTDPATDFALTSRFFLPQPLGKRRCVKNIGADLFILHNEGVTNLSSLMQGVDAAGQYTQFNDAIGPTFINATTIYGSNDGWELFFYPHGNWALINVPTASSTRAYQHVMNTKTGAWCRFTGINSICWALLDGVPYFGGASGKIYRADYTMADNATGVIDAKVKFAFNYFGVMDRSKAFHMAVAKVVGSGDIRLKFGLDCDGANESMAGDITINTNDEATWDTATWDVDSWSSAETYSSNWEGLQGYGRAGAITVAGKFRAASLRLNSIQVIYELGGYL